MSKPPAVYGYNHNAPVPAQSQMPYSTIPTFWADKVRADESGIVTRLRRRKSWFIMTTALTAVVVSGIYSITPNSYRAQGNVLIVATSNDSSMSTQNPQAMEKVGDAADIESQLILLRSPQLLHELLETNPSILASVMQECSNMKSTPLAQLKEQVHNSKKCSEILGTIEDQVEWLSGRYEIASAGRSRVISVTYTSDNPRIAALMVNALIDAYIKKGTEEKLGPRGRASKFLASELAGLRVELRNSEEAMERYRKEHGLVKGSTSSIQAENLSSLSQQLAVAQGTRAQALAEMQQGQRGSSTMRNVTSSPTVTALRAQEAGVAARVAQLGTTLGANNPQLKAARDELSNIRGQIGSEIGRASTGLNQTFQAADSQVKDLQRQIAALRNEATSASNYEAAIANMASETDIKRTLYTDYMKRATQLATESNLIASDARVVNHADKPTSPWFPKLTPFAVAGSIIALALGTVVAVFRDRADRTVRATIALESATLVPVMGHIPMVGRYRQKPIRNDKGSITIHPQLLKPSALQEAVRMLYAQCFHMLGADSPKNIMVTSGDPGEGKTFLTLALAQFAATAGHKVLAIEADLRKPTFADRLQVQRDIGLIQYLDFSIAANVETVIQETRIPGLHLITAGGTTIKSTELLSTSRFQTLLSEVSNQYDYVFIDSPPSHILMDARLMAKHVDSILYCAKWGKTENDAIAMGIKALTTAGGNVAGIVLGQVRNGEYKLYGTRKTYTTAPYMMGDGT